MKQARGVYIENASLLSSLSTYKMITCLMGVTKVRDQITAREPSPSQVTLGQRVEEVDENTYKINAPFPRRQR